MPSQEDRYGVAQLSEPGLPAVLQSLLGGLAGFGAAGRLPQVYILQHTGQLWHLVSQDILRCQRQPQYGFREGFAQGCCRTEMQSQRRAVYWPRPLKPAICCRAAAGRPQRAARRCCRRNARRRS